MQRTIIAYLLIAMMVAAASGWILYMRHHSRERSYHRRLKRERAEYERRMAASERR